MQFYSQSIALVHCASVSKRVREQNLSYIKNEFDLHESEPVSGNHFHWIVEFARRLASF